MKTFSLNLLLAVAVLSPLGSLHAAGQTPVREHVTPEQRKDVVAAIDAWRKAVVDKDRAGLERAYHPDLSYGHTDGHVLTRQEQIDRTIVPDRDFTAVDVDGLAVRVHGDVAYVTATYTFHVKPKGEAVRLAKLPGLDVWTKGTGGWQLIARQLTKAPA